MKNVRIELDPMFADRLFKVLSGQVDFAERVESTGYSLMEPSLNAADMRELIAALTPAIKRIDKLSK